MVESLLFDTTRDSVQVLPTDFVGSATTNGLFHDFYMPAYAELIHAFVKYEYMDYFGVIGGRHRLYII